MYFQPNQGQKPQQYQSNKSPYPNKPLKKPNQSFSGQNNQFQPRPPYQNMNKHAYRLPPKSPQGHPRHPNQPRPNPLMRTPNHQRPTGHPSHLRPPGQLRNKAITVPNGMKSQFVKSNSNPMAPNQRPNFQQKMRNLSRLRRVTGRQFRPEAPDPPSANGQTPTANALFLETKLIPH